MRNVVSNGEGISRAMTRGRGATREAGTRTETGNGTQPLLGGEQTRVESEARASGPASAPGQRGTRPYVRNERPSLSLAITAGGPPQRVHALLTLMRPYVDEIVLAVDRGRDTAALEVCAELADRRFTFEVTGSASALIGWVFHQCSCDWILRLDDDEVPSRALLDALPALISDRRPVDAAVGRRWLYPTAERFITNHPWGDERLYRVRQNLPGLWSFAGTIHTDGTTLGPKRFLDAAIYHLDLLLQTAADRRRKALRYEALSPGFAFEGVDVNLLYVPELIADIETMQVPIADRELIDAVVAGSLPKAAPGGGAPVHAASTSEIARFNSARSASPNAYRATLRFRRSPREVPAATQRHFDMLVRNDGDERWSWQQDLPIRLGYRYRERSTGRVVIDGRSNLPETVEPGEEILAPLATLTPAAPGEYVLEADMVHEHVRWFGAEIRAAVTVHEAPHPLDAAMGRGAFDDELRTEHNRLRREGELARGDLEATRSQLQAARAEAEAARAEAAAGRASAAGAREFKRTRRYRAAQALAAPIDAVRRLVASHRARD